MKLTMSGEVLSHSLPLEKAIEITASFGVSNFELWAQNLAPLASGCHARLYKDRDIESAKKQFQKTGIHVACVAFGGAFHSEVVADRDLYIRELIRAEEVAADLGAELVNHYCNFLSPRFALDFDVLDRYYSQPLKRAEELGITLVLENEAHDMTHTPENVLAIIEHFNSIYFRSNLDATNFYQAGNEAFPYAYELLKEVIAYVHIKNGRIYIPNQGLDDLWRGGDMSGHFAGQKIYYTLPILGAVNIAGLVDRLTSDGYAGYLTLEPHSSLENVLSYYEVALPWIRGLASVEPALPEKLS